MKPINIGGHAACQDRVLEQLRKYYPDAADSLPASTWEVMEKFWNLDLSETDLIMQDRYSDFGFLMMAASRPKYIPQRKSPGSQRKKGRKHRPSKSLPSGNSLKNLNRRLHRI